MWQKYWVSVRTGFYTNVHVKLPLLNVAGVFHFGMKDGVTYPPYVSMHTSRNCKSLWNERWIMDFSCVSMHTVGNHKYLTLELEWRMDHKSFICVFTFRWKSYLYISLWNEGQNIYSSYMCIHTAGNHKYITLEWRMDHGFFVYVYTYCWRWRMLGYSTDMCDSALLYVWAYAWITQPLFRWSCYTACSGSVRQFGPCVEQSCTMQGRTGRSSLLQMSLNPFDLASRSSRRHPYTQYPNYCLYGLLKLKNYIN